MLAHRCVSTVHFGKAKDLVVNNDLDDGGLPLLRDGSVSTYTVSVEL